jgi:hypothetical protein
MVPAHAEIEIRTVPLLCQKVFGISDKGLSPIRALHPANANGSIAIIIRKSTVVFLFSTDKALYFLFFSSGTDSIKIWHPAL